MARFAALVALWQPVCVSLPRQPLFCPRGVLAGESTYDGATVEFRGL